MNTTNWEIMVIHEYYFIPCNCCSTFDSFVYLSVFVVQLCAYQIFTMLLHPRLFMNTAHVLCILTLIVPQISQDISIKIINTLVPKKKHSRFDIVDKIWRWYYLSVAYIFIRNQVKIPMFLSKDVLPIFHRLGQQAYKPNQIHNIRPFRSLLWWLPTLHWIKNSP